MDTSARAQNSDPLSISTIGEDLTITGNVTSTGELISTVEFMATSIVLR